MFKLDVIELKDDYRTHDFSKEESLDIFKLLKTSKCKFCNVNLKKDKARFYQHNSGWKTTKYYETIWIWFECPKCNHGWSINKLGVPRTKLILV